MNQKFDLCVIGAGPGGYVASIIAGRLGLKTALVEKEFFGGTCLNWGCIPTKTLIASSEILAKIKHSADFGININGNAEADWPAMLNRKEKIVETLRKGISALLNNAGVTTIHGTAKFADKKTISITDSKDKTQKISADKFIIATGCDSAVPGFLPKSERILTSRQILEIQKIPESLLILGGGVIGCEFACLFAELGTKVTVVEMLPQILPTVDEELSKLLSREMKKKKINLITGTMLEDVKVRKSAIEAKAGKEKINSEFMLVAIGRNPVTKNLDPEKAGIKTDEKGFVRVDSKCRTNVPNIYAIGDVTGRIQLAHLASAMANCAAKNAIGKNCEFRDDLVPGCIFTCPEIATVGLTEKECSDNNIAVNIGKFPFLALGKAMAIGETAGFCKIISSKENDQVLGVHIIGPHATDLISEAVTAMNLEITATELGKVIHPHPTLGEVVMETAHAVHNESAHMLK